MEYARPMSRGIALIASCLWVLAGCGDDDDTDDALDAGADAAVLSDGGRDGGTDVDAAMGTDGGVETDAGVDADGGPADGGTTDAGPRLGPGECRGDADCTGASCFAPGSFIGCGICITPPVTCTDDGECGDGEICDVAPEDCHCSGETTCRAGCTAGSCDAGEMCTDGRCEPAACGAGDPCEAQFDCTDGRCARRSCTSDAACDDAGYCVEGACFDSPGSCSVLPP